MAARSLCLSAGIPVPTTLNIYTHFIDAWHRKASSGKCTQRVETVTSIGCSAAVSRGEIARHVLMNIGGANDLTLIPNISMEQWNRVFEVNVNGTLMGIQTCAPLMKDSGGGSIINIGSVAGISGTFRRRTARRSGGRGAIALRGIYGRRLGNPLQCDPAGIHRERHDKAMTSNPIMEKPSKQTMNNTVLLRRMGKAEEIASTALFLASDDSSYITGTDIVVDGGWFSRRVPG